MEIDAPRSLGSREVEEDEQAIAPSIEQNLDALRAHLAAIKTPAEGFALYLAAERTSFVRFNQGKVRQPGSIRQLEATLRLYASGSSDERAQEKNDASRQASAHLSLTGNVEYDRGLLTKTIERMREVMLAVSPDPHLLRPPAPKNSIEGQAGLAGQVSAVEDGSSDDAFATSDQPSAIEMVKTVLDAAQDHDLVGLLTTGSVERAFACDRGQRNIFRTSSYVLDYSVYRARDKAVKDKAVKDQIGGLRFEAEKVAARVKACAERSRVLDQPERALPPGRYRAFLSPAAVYELFFLLSVDGFGQQGLQTRQSPLVRLYERKAAFDSRVSVACDVRGVAPTFSDEGWVREPRIPLITRGQADGALTSGRTAAEFDLVASGVSGAEAPTAIVMEGGDLPQAEALSALGTGIWISDLWYSNWSDRPAARLTGMTRFATLWVENGEVVGPIKAARFDDSLYRMLGENLEALTVERDLIFDTDTYERRALGRFELPGALLSSLEITL